MKKRHVAMYAFAVFTFAAGASASHGSLWYRSRNVFQKKQNVLSVVSSTQRTNTLAMANTPPPPQGTVSTQTAPSSQFRFLFEANTTVNETGSMNQSAHPNWWINSGGRMIIADGIGKTIQGSLPADDYWRKAYAASTPSDTDNGYHPQNIFRAITRSQWINADQEAYFKINRDNLSASASRAASNGVGIMTRYSANGDTFYYTGLRVDGAVVVKKKLSGAYTTLGSKKIYPGTYDRISSPNLLPHGTWLGLKSIVENQSDGSVRIRVYSDQNRSGNWALLLDVRDMNSPIRGSGYAGIRTDFMDAEFDNYRVLEAAAGGASAPSTTPNPPAPNPPPAPGSTSSFEQRVFDLVNQERRKAGIAPLMLNTQLTKAAEDYAKTMADRNFFSHTGIDGSSPWSRIQATGYQASTVGENIARGQQTPEAVMQSWMASSGHRANILNGSFKEIGVGFDRNYWVQDFAAPRATTPAPSPIPPPPVATTPPPPPPASQPASAPTSLSGQLSAEDCQRLINSSEFFYDNTQQVIGVESRLRSQGRTADANLMRQISCRSQATWLVGGSPDSIRSRTAGIMARAKTQGKIPVLVLYNVPSYNNVNWNSGIGGTDGHRSWINGVAEGIGQNQAWVMLEPDSLGLLPNLSAQDQETRINQIRTAISILKQKAPNARVYLDGAHSTWRSPQVTAGLLNRAGIAQADGFFSNVSNFRLNSQEIANNKTISSLVGNKHFVIDTSRNGIGPSPDNEWCNPRGVALGRPSTRNTGEPLLDAFIWVKPPGESDESCNGGPPPGQFWVDQALSLIRNANNIR